jgi:hypothetical protein
VLIAYRDNTHPLQGGQDTFDTTRFIGLSSRFQKGYDRRDEPNGESLAITWFFAESGGAYTGEKIVRPPQEEVSRCLRAAAGNSC